MGFRQRPKTQRDWRSFRPWVGFLWAAAATAFATGGFWLFRASLDKGQASLLYLPVVIACAIRFGFGPAVAGAVLSFLCWNFFFLPPLDTLAVSDPKDWLSLVIFLIAAVTTAHLAARARAQTEEARVRERETLTLFQASEALSGEADDALLLPALAAQIARTCGTLGCVVLRREASGMFRPVATVADAPPSSEDEHLIAQMARSVAEHNLVVGFGRTRHLWAKALGHSDGAADRGPGAYVPLRVKGALVGVLHVGPRRDGQPFFAQDQRLIMALANHAAVVIARQALAEEAAQAVALREADALKDALLSLVSHELRTPLAAIKAAASGLMQRGAVWPEAARDAAIRTVDAEADRLTALVSNLLDLSRLEAGAWRPDKDWCDLGEIVATALDRLPEADAARVRVDSPADLPLVRADYVQIALVLTNLLQNAIKYGALGGAICLNLTRDEPGVHVAVRDFGDGVTPGDEETIFRRFYRSARHVDSTVHGTGLGLALCREVIQAHGGRIWVSNAPAEEPPGAVFSFFLPTAGDAGPEEDVPNGEG